MIPRRPTFNREPLLESMARKWFASPSRVARLESWGLGMAMVATTILGTCVALIFLPVAGSAHGPLKASLFLSMAATLAGLAGVAWMACDWLCSDAFETNEEAVGLLERAGIPADRGWHLSRAEQALVRRLWHPAATRRSRPGI